MIPSWVTMDSLAPRVLPRMAKPMMGAESFQLTSPCRIKRTAARAVPQVEESLLVAMAL